MNSKNFYTQIHMIPGLKRLTDTVHKEGGKIAFQLVHAGRQTTRDFIGQRPMAPSKGSMDPIYMTRHREMTEAEIQMVIEAFAKAAARAAEAGADGVQLNAAHGYLLSQFISPFFNRRTDAWGDSDENRFRFLKETILACQGELPGNIPLMIKINTIDYTPRDGLTVPIAKKYAGWLAEMRISAVEVTSGTLCYSMFNVMRGDVPADELVMGLPWWMKPIGRTMMRSRQGKFELEGPYNLEAARMIKPALKDIPLMLVGGLRTVSEMATVLNSGQMDFISICRPFIREPFLIKKIRTGKAHAATCVSCNRCFAAVANDISVGCYQNKFPTHKIRTFAK